MMLTVGVQPDISPLRAFTFDNGQYNMGPESNLSTRFHDKTPEDSKSPPSCPRQPPDGDEAPPIPTELPSAQSKPRWASSATLPKTPRKFFSRSQDARSECSVKDKIAMFSSNKSPSIEKLDICIPKSPISMFRPEYTSKNISTNKLDKRFAKSTDNLDNMTKRYSLDNREKRPEVVGSVNILNNIKTTITKTKEKREPDKITWINSDVNDNCSTAILSHHKRNSHSRSQSDSSYKSTLDYLIEQRKKSMSKLRGLMIPDAKPICDLPEIKVQENKLDDIKVQSSFSLGHGAKHSITTAKITSWTTAVPNIVPKYSPAFKRKSLQLFSGVPLSKEYKSKGESIKNEYDNSKINERLNVDCKSKAPSKPPRASIENKKSFSSHTLNCHINQDKGHKILSEYSVSKASSDVCITKQKDKGDVVDSDNDSAVSSTQSSYRSSPSSPSLRNVDSVESDSSHCSLVSSDRVGDISHKDAKQKSDNLSEQTFTAFKKRSIYRSLSSETNTSIASSGGSVLTSGSQASCSSMESSVPETGRQKITKTKSIEAINRRNILASAKCRSGRDFKINSPVIESKFNHEQEVTEPPLGTKPSEKNTPLNVSISKSESIRRIRPTSIHDTDSDSDCERVGQRKYDIKTSRLRKGFYKQEIKNESKLIDTVTESKCHINNDNAYIKLGQRSSSISNVNIRNKIEANDTKECTPNVVNSNRTNILFSRNLKTDVSERDSMNTASKDTNILDLNLSSSQDKIYSTKKPLIKTENKSLVSLTVPDSDDSTTVRIERGAGAGIGLILAGGIDCEAKTVTIHKILIGSPAEKDGRLCKGDRILSINSKLMDGLTHAESVRILKEPKKEVILVVEKSKDIITSNANEAEIKSSQSTPVVPSSDVMNVELVKSGAGAGLGLGLEGGKDSPSGDGPLLIKKLFTGGAAAKTGLIQVGAVLEAVNGIKVNGMTRTEAWNLLKSIPEGPVTLSIKPATK